MPVNVTSGDAKMSFNQNCSAKCLDGYDGNASLPAVVYRCTPRAGNRSKGGWHPEGGQALQCDRSATPPPAGDTTGTGVKVAMYVIAGLMAVSGLAACMKVCKAKRSSKFGILERDTMGDGIELNLKLSRLSVGKIMVGDQFGMVGDQFGNDKL